MAVKADWKSGDDYTPEAANAVATAVNGAADDVALLAESLGDIELTPGPPGQSAYQVAVANGFSGTEAEWLTSLQGAGEDGTDGDPGKSAYEVAVANGFVGTEQEWLTSLQASPAFVAIPVLSIDTNDVPILDRETWVPAVFGLDGLVLDGDIRGRGNSTWATPKKPWNIRLDVTTSLLGMPGAKRWSLLANYSDVTMVHNATAFEVGRRCTGLDWTPRSRFVRVVLNGIDAGLYQLTEPVRMEANRLEQTAASGSTGLPLTGTYLLEADFHFDAAQQWLTVHDGLPIMMDDPDGTNATSGAAQYNYIRDWINNFETVLYDDDLWLNPDTGYARFIDRDSFIDYYLVAELCANQDAGLPGSLKMYKTRDTDTEPGRLHLGPLWDYDLAMGETWTTYSPEGWWVRGTSQPPTGGVQPGMTWIARMMGDPAFKAATVTRWGQIAALLTDLGGWIEKTAQGIAVARRDDYTLWESGIHPYSPWRTKTDYLIGWLQDRITWITANIGVVEDTTAPSVPTGLVASAITATGFTVTWESSTDDTAVTGYQVRLNGGAAITKTGLSHNFSGLAAETAYDVEVRAGDAAGNWSGWSAPLPVTTSASGSTLPEPVAAWGFAEASGTVAADSIGSADLTATASGMLGNTGHTGNGLRQVGTNSASVSSSIVAGNTERTLMCWARRGNTNGGFIRGPMLQIGGVGGGSIFGIFLASPSPGVQFRARPAADIDAPLAPVGEWHHYAVTASGGVMRAYIDGVQFGSDVSIGGVLEAGHTALTIFDADGDAGWDVDDVRVFTVGLTSGEVAEYMDIPT